MEKGDKMNESTIFGVSARGILAFIVTLSCCMLAIWVKDIGVLKDLAFLVLGSYFSRQSALGGSTTSTTVSTTTPTETPKTGV